jgi:hypothetical protein
MPLPSNLTTIILTGKFLDSTGAPLSGSISFTPPPELVDPANAIMYSQSVTATLDSSGTFSVTLLCTDNAALLPVGWWYQVIEIIRGTRTYPIYLPHAYGSTVDLSSIVPVPDMTGAPAVIPAGVVAPGYAGLSIGNTFTGSNSFTGPVTFSSTVTGATPSGAAGGDLAGSFPNPTVTATANFKTQVETVRLDQMAAPTASINANSQKIIAVANGTASSDVAAFGQIPGALPPNGAASGDLSGTYPAPTVAKVSGVAVSGTAASGKTLVATSSSAAAWNYSGVSAWFNVKSYGAKGDGATDDTTAIGNAHAAARAAGGGVVYFPGGTYMVTPVSSTTAAIVWNNGTSGDKGIRWVGDSAWTTQIKRLSAGPIISMSGPSTDVSAATHCEYCGLENLVLSGNSLTGALIQTYYADNLSFVQVRFANSNDVGQDCAEFWDSRYYHCVWDTNGSTTANASAPNLWLRNSAATSGFGYSGDTVNNIYLVGCRFEQYKTGAIRMERGLGTNIGQPYSIYLLDTKIETANVNGGPSVFVDVTARDIRITNMHAYVGGFYSGYSTAQDVITFGPQFGALEDILIFNSTAVACIANGVTVNAPLAGATVRLENVRGSYTGGATPTGAHVNFGTQTGTILIDNCSTDNGALYAGTTPNSGTLNNVQTFTSSGTWTKPPGAAMVTVLLVGGGGGGGSGAVEASGTVASGGAGGGGGGYSMVAFPAALLSSTETVTVGTGGTGGTAVGTTASNGNAGGNGGTTSFKSVNFAVAGGGGGGGGGTTSAATCPFAGGGSSAGGTGGSSSGTGGAGSTGNGANQAAPGGGAGGGVTTAPAASAGGAGGVNGVNGGLVGGSAGSSGGGTGGGGQGAGANFPSAGSGGGGGGSFTTGNGGAGGVGGNYGAGGGGGGATLTTHNSGAGGNGANGIVVVITTVTV